MNYMSPCVLTACQLVTRSTGQPVSQPANRSAGELGSRSTGQPVSDEEFHHSLCSVENLTLSENCGVKQSLAPGEMCPSWSARDVASVACNRRGCERLAPPVMNVSVPDAGIPTPSPVQVRSVWR